MQRFFVFLFVLISFFGLGCDITGRQIQARTANAVASAANSALPLLVERYQREGEQAIASASDRSTAEAEISAIKKRWAPIWKAWETLRVAEDAWATSIENGGDLGAALPALKAAYCDLLKVWPSQIPAIPISLVRCSP